MSAVLDWSRPTNYLRTHRRSAVAAIVAVAAIIVVGAFLVATKAATSVVSTEPETGTKTAKAVAVSDTAASGGQAVKFGTASGSVWPDSTNTGYPAGTTFTDVDGPSWHPVAGATYTGLHFHNYVNVTVANVTIKNCWFTSTGDYITLDATGSTNLLLQDSKFDGPALTAQVVGDAGSVFRRLDISQAQGDAVRLNPGASMYDSFVHDLGFVTGAHQDGVQFSETPYNNTVSGNRFVMSHNATSSIIMSGGGTLAALHDMHITNNLLDGGGYAIYAQNSKPGGATEGSYNIVITGNVFTRNYDYGPVAFWAAGTGNVWANNTFSDNGAQVPAQ